MTFISIKNICLSVNDLHNEKGRKGHFAINSVTVRVIQDRFSIGNNKMLLRTEGLGMYCGK